MVQIWRSSPQAHICCWKSSWRILLFNLRRKKSKSLLVLLCDFPAYPQCVLGKYSYIKFEVLSHLKITTIILSLLSQRLSPLIHVMLVVRLLMAWPYIALNVNLMSMITVYGNWRIMLIWEGRCIIIFMCWITFINGC